MRAIRPRAARRAAPRAGRWATGSHDLRDRPWEAASFPRELRCGKALPRAFRIESRQFRAWCVKSSNLSIAAVSRVEGPAVDRCAARSSEARANESRSDEEAEPMLLL